MALTAEIVFNDVSVLGSTARSFHNGGAPPDNVVSLSLHPGRLRARTRCPSIFSIHHSSSDSRIHWLQKEETLSLKELDGQFVLSHSQSAREESRHRKLRQHAAPRCESGGRPARLDVAPKM